MFLSVLHDWSVSHNPPQCTGRLFALHVCLYACLHCLWVCPTLMLYFFCIICAFDCFDLHGYFFICIAWVLVSLHRVDDSVCTEWVFECFNCMNGFECVGWINVLTECMFVLHKCLCVYWTIFCMIALGEFCFMSEYLFAYCMLCCMNDSVVVAL